MTRAIRILSAVTVAVLALTGVGVPANGAPAPDIASGGNAPGGWSIGPSAYQDLFGSAGVGEPQGTLVADSGFRPYPHGFPIPNWGSADSFAQNQVVYGLPERLTLDNYKKGNYEGPAPLNSLSLRRTLGDGVCQDAKKIDPKTGECKLILGAELLAQMIESAGAGGHCFGIAAAAAALYNGQLPANQVGASGLGINANNQMGNPAVQTITRLYGTQYFNNNFLTDIYAGQSPTEIVQTLIKTLPSGQVPFLLSIVSEIGGHGITPYAVLDRGNGLFDIAVYDNNFPFRALALTVDTNTDSFVYTSATNPNSPTYTWSTATNAAISLTSIDEILAVQPCQVCRGKDTGTLLAFSSWDIKNNGLLGITLLDTQGNGLASDLYRKMAPLNPANQEQVSAPLIVINPGVEFTVEVAAGALVTPQSLEVYAMSNGASDVLTLEDIPAQSTVKFAVYEKGTIFSATKPSSPRIQQLADGKENSYEVNGHPLDLPKGVYVAQEWDRQAKTVRYSTTAKQTLKWNIQIDKNPTPTEFGWAGLSVEVPAGSDILVDYATMSGVVPPLAWVVGKDKSRTPITMVKITTALLKAEKANVYTVVGPG